MIPGLPKTFPLQIPFLNAEIERMGGHPCSADEPSNRSATVAVTRLIQRKTYPASADCLADEDRILLASSVSCSAGYVQNLAAG